MLYGIRWAEMAHATGAAQDLDHGPETLRTTRLTYTLKEGGRKAED